MIFIGMIVVVVVNNPTPTGAMDTSEVVPKSPMDTSRMGNFVACPKCDEWYGHYDTPAQAKKALGGHKRWCTGKRNKSPFGRPIK